MVHVKIRKKDRSYSITGMWPSVVARVMTGTRIGQWQEDLLPRTHIMADCGVANDRRHLSHPSRLDRASSVSWRSCLLVVGKRLSLHDPCLQWR